MNFSQVNFTPVQGSYRKAIVRAQSKRGLANTENNY